METCRVCNADVASSAKSCPHCGAKKPSLDKVEFLISEFVLEPIGEAIKWLLILLLIFVVLVLLILF